MNAIKTEKAPALGRRFLNSSLSVESGINCVYVFLVKLLRGYAEGFTEALVVDDLALAQEADDVADVGVVAEAEDVVIGNAGLLLGGHVLGQVCYDVALDADAGSAPGRAGGGSGVDAGGVVNEIGVVTSLFYLLGRHAPRQLVDDGSNHLKMSQFLGAYIVAKIAHLKNAVNTVFLHYTPHIRYTQVTDWDKLLIGCLRMFIMRLFFTDFSKVCSLASRSHHLLTGFCYNFIVHSEVMHK